MRISRFTGILLAALTLPGLLSCAGLGTRDNFVADEGCADTLTHHARFLTLVDYGNGRRLAEIANPWAPDQALARYLLVDRDSTLPDNTTADIAVIRTPVQRAAVFSAVHTGAMKELDALGSLAAVADASFFPAGDTVGVMLAQKRIADVGAADSPSVERLAAAGIEAVLRAPMQTMSSGTFPKGMVPVEMADYLETTPIARAEWLLFLGELFGEREKAREIFQNVIEDYSNLALKVKLADEAAPKVLTETEYMGVWYVAAGESYQAAMLADAGADYPWAATEGTGSLSLSLENVAEAAMDADFWLVRSFGYETTPESLKAMNPRYSSFKALKNGDIYSCDSAERLIFNDMAFHPEKILADYIAIFHPDLMPGYELKYFKRTGR